MGKEIKKHKGGDKKKKTNNTKGNDMALAASSLGISKKPKTHKGKKVLENKAPKIIENPKSAIFIKGKKSSIVVNTLLKELHIIRGGELNKLFLRKSHDMHPFEDHAPLETISKK